VEGIVHLRGPETSRLRVGSWAPVRQLLESKIAQIGTTLAAKSDKPHYSDTILVMVQELAFSLVLYIVGTSGGRRDIPPRYPFARERHVISLVTRTHRQLYTINNLSGWNYKCPALLNNAVVTGFKTYYWNWMQEGRSRSPTEATYRGSCLTNMVTKVRAFRAFSPLKKELESQSPSYHFKSLK